jgi:hypothetical protein
MYDGGFVVHRWVILIYATTVQKQRLVPIK